MGQTISAITPSRRKPQDPSPDSDSETDDDVRPAKRRKITTQDGQKSSNSRGQTSHQLTRAPTRSTVATLKPASFYGVSSASAHGVASPSVANLSVASLSVASRKRKHSVTPKKPVSINEVLGLLKEPINFHAALRVSVLHITRDPDEQHQAGSSIGKTDIKCACTLSVFDSSKPFQLLIHRDTQNARIRTSSEHHGPLDIVMPNAFHVPSGKLFTNRDAKKWESDLPFDQVFDLAPKYHIVISLTPRGSQKGWPLLVQRFLPPDCRIARKINRRQATLHNLSLEYDTARLMDPDMQQTSKSLMLKHGGDSEETTLMLRVDVAWSLPSHFCQKVAKSHEARAPMRPSSQPVCSQSSNKSPVEEVWNGTPETPERDRSTRRTTKVESYNVRSASRQQLGWSPLKDRKKASESALAPAEEQSDNTVTYTLMSGDAGFLGVKRETIMHGLKCPFCEREHSSIATLRLHHRICHDLWVFTVKREKPRLNFLVRLKEPSAHRRNERTRTFKLGRPRSLFDLEKFLNGDDTWIREREGNETAEGLQTQDSSRSPSPIFSRQSSSNTTHDAVDDIDVDLEELKIASKPRKKLLVWPTEKPLYDPISKRVLQAGEEVPDSDDEKDEEWLFQRQRDIVLDFTDVTDDEKDFINRWNPFILEEQLTSTLYLKEAIHKFVERDKVWFMERKSRPLELFKCLELWKLRGAISQDFIHKCIGILREVGRACKKEDVEMKDTKVGPMVKVRVLRQCICGDFTQPPDQIICRAKNCKARWYHRNCIEAGPPIDARTWHCSECVLEATR